MTFSNRPVLVDSCWYIQRAREGIDPLHALRFLAETRDIATCGIVKAEVGRGIQEQKRLERYVRAWEVMMYVDSSSQLWDETLELAWRLDRSGITLPVQDVHIAACARSIGAVILTHDAHFQKIPGVDATDRIF